MNTNMESAYDNGYARGIYMGILLGALVPIVFLASIYVVFHYLQCT